MMKSILCIAIIALAAAPPQTTVPSMRVVLLGTGTPGADPDRWGPAVAIVAGDQSYLVDAGPGVVRRAAAAARERQLPALTAARLTRVFITHLHSDHTLGLPDLMLSPWVLGRPVPLDVYGPKGIAEMASSVEHAYQADIDMRLHGGEPQTTQNYHAVTHDVAAGPVYRDALVTVDAIAVAHGTWAEAFGYRFRGDGRTVVISGDTRPTDALVDACRGCDVLVHEVYPLRSSRHNLPHGRPITRRFTRRPWSWRKSLGARGRSSWCCITNSSGVPVTRISSAKFATPVTQAR